MIRYRRHPDVVWREEEDEKRSAEAALEAGEDVDGVATAVLLLHGKMIALNILGTEIWERCEGQTLSGLTAELMALFEVPEDVLRDDLIDFLGELERHGFVHAE